MSRGGSTSYKSVNAVQCGAAGTKVWGLCFNQLDYGYRNWAAAVGGPVVLVIDVLDEDKKLQMVEIFRDDDKSELFYSVCWASNDRGDPLVCAAGENGVIRVINILTGEIYQSLVGHGGSINDLRVHPRNRSWLLSGAKDETARMWNIKTGVMIAIFGGDEGHRGDVLSVDFRERPVDQPIVATCGMDKTVKLWQIPEHLMPRVHEAETWDQLPSKVKTINVKFTVSTERTLHQEFADCVRWVGRFVLSKAANGDEEAAKKDRSVLPPNKILLWNPTELEEPSTALPRGLNATDGADSGPDLHVDSGHVHRKTTVISEYEIPRSHHWFNKFATDFFQRIVACGNDYGEVFVYDLHAYPPCRLATLSNHSKNVPSQCRQVAVSYDGKTILSCHDNGLIWRWEKTEA